MVKDLDKDLALIDEAMNNFIQVMSRPRAWEQIVDRAGVNLDRAGATLLHFLEQADTKHCHLNEIAKRLGIEAPSVTRKVQQLEKLQLVHRIPDKIDRRAYLLEITNSGRQILNRLRKAKRNLLAETLAQWPAVERHEFALLFHRLSQDMVSYRGPSTEQLTQVEEKYEHAK